MHLLLKSAKTRIKIPSKFQNMYPFHSNMYQNFAFTCRYTFKNNLLEQHSIELKGKTTLATLGTHFDKRVFIKLTFECICLEEFSYTLGIIAQIKCEKSQREIGLHMKKETQVKTNSLYNHSSTLS
jgi:hypothetical protein